MRKRPVSDTLDRYIAGEDVPFTDARRAWRETSASMCSVSGFYTEFFPLVRPINQSLPRGKRLRFLVGEPAVDWSVPHDTRGLGRDASLASVTEREVLSKHRKALMLCGTGHLYHRERRGTAVSQYEEIYPGRTLVIQTHDGFAAFIDLERGRELESRMRAWPVPSIVPLKGTWLADLDLPYFFWPLKARLEHDLQVIAEALSKDGEEFGEERLLSCVRARLRLITNCRPRLFWSASSTQFISSAQAQCRAMI